jgi:hypothetical protein
MSTDQTENQAESQATWQAVAQNPDAFVAYLADVQRVLLGIGKNLETLQRETRVHLRGTHVEGDRWYHARMRALPVERQLKEVLKHLEGVTAGLEKGAFKRRAHDEEVNHLPGKRREKAIAKSRKKKRPVLPAAPESAAHSGQAQDSVYGGPTSIYDLGDRWSA